jgi:sterol desaturase/sphingolipid hydroxylase (fatty acid hydroxylase superfamily)
MRLHEVHHVRAAVNFGITTTVWDRVMGTFDPGTETSRRYGLSRTIKSYHEAEEQPSATSWE